MPRNAASDAIVVVPGVATSSSGSAASAGGSGFGMTATWRFAAYPHDSHRTRTSSPAGLSTMNSWARLPPIIPTSELTAMVSSPRRSNVRT